MPARLVPSGASLHQSKTPRLRAPSHRAINTQPVTTKATPTTHNVAASKGQPNLNLFFRNLRLLDLDQAEDRLEISLETFCSRDAGARQTTRTQHAEWVLYHLFDIWDREQTEARLSPYYPAPERSQSIKLRLELHKWLTELKASGYLPPDIALRKTTLDECQGSKYHELLITFSTLVLQHTLHQQSSIVARICRPLPYTTQAREYQSLLPLATAHRASLQHILARKRQLRQYYMDLKAALDSKEQELDRKFAAIVKRQAVLDESDVPEGAIARLARQLDENWCGDKRFVDVIMYGERAVSEDKFLGRDFETDIWPAVEKGEFLPDLSTLQDGLLERLELQVAQQDQRLRHWRSIKAEMTRQMHSTQQMQGKSPTRMDSHGAIHSQASLAGRAREKELVFSPRKSPRKSEVVDIAMRVDSDRGGASGMLKPRSDLAVADSTETLAPKRQGSGTRINPARLFATQIAQKQTQHQSDGGPNASALLGSEGLALDLTMAEAVPNQQEDESFVSSSPAPADVQICRGKDSEDLAAAIIRQTLQANATPLQNYTSLADRTRQSMALAPSPVQSPARKSTFNPTDNATSPALAGPQTLQERTRQSICLATASTSKTRKAVPSKDRRRSARPYPTNQFETPYKGSPFRPMTPPQEALMSGAGYDSVFRSRPRIVHSPTPTPETDLLRHREA